MSVEDIPVTIALCTYNGERHLQAQLDSYLCQTHCNWSLWVSDDNSTDGTWDILQQFKADYGARYDIRLMRGPRKGACQNYLSLLSHPEFPSGYVALSDQDDVWMRGKLMRALQRILREEPGPLIYGAQSFHSDSGLRLIGRSRMPHGELCFGNALVQNVISGHSAVLTPEALQIVRQAGVPEGVPYHDWWLYQLVTGAGGRAIVDGREVLRYRKHDLNLIGPHAGPRALGARIRLVLGNHYRRWIETNAEALLERRALLTPHACETLEMLLASKNLWGPARVAEVRRLGLHRQSTIGTAFLYLAGALGRV